MKLSIDNILRPNATTLTLFGVLSLIGLTLYVWFFSFAWDFLFGVDFFINALVIILLFGLLIAAIIDIRNNLRLKLYFIISIFQLGVISTVADPIRTWQIDSSLKKAKQITDTLEVYKQQFGTYPTTLKELEQKLNKPIPSRTSMGTRFIYELDGKDDYNLRFVSYYGCTAYYNITDDNWNITD